MLPATLPKYFYLYLLLIADCVIGAYCFLTLGSICTFFFLPKKINMYLHTTVIRFTLGLVVPIVFRRLDLCLLFHQEAEMYVPLRGLTSFYFRCCQVTERNIFLALGIGRPKGDVY